MPEPLCINGEWVTPSNFNLWRSGKSGFDATLGNFLQEWYNDCPYMQLHTSGSTGSPQLIRATKEAMRASARMSCKVFGLTRNSSVLLSLPLQYIAGKMMVVRALVSGAEILPTEPTSTPLAKLHQHVDFAPLVPMQAATTLRQPGGREQLERARCILLGGGFIDTALEQELQEVNSAVFASYGMTETLSHIALRRVNGPERSLAYTPLPGVHVRLSAQGTLCISATHLGIEEMETNDLAEIAADGSFRILGRRDSVINSGGIKIQAEEVEQQLTAATGLSLLVGPVPDALLGQCAALLWEGPLQAEDALRHAISTLPPYHRPRIVRHVDSLPRTASGKIRRGAVFAG